jgi:hypothetical protein
MVTGVSTSLTTPCFADSESAGLREGVDELDFFTHYLNQTDMDTSCRQNHVASRGRLQTRLGGLGTKVQTLEYCFTLLYSLRCYSLARDQSVNERSACHCQCAL